jgi:hypothetical protein
VGVDADFTGIRRRGCLKSRKNNISTQSLPDSYRDYQGKTQSVNIQTYSLRLSDLAFNFNFLDSLLNNMLINLLL